MRLFVPAMVLVEAPYRIGTRLGPAVEVAFLAALSDLDVVAPSHND